MSVKILSVAKQLPKHTRETKDIIPFVKLWMLGQETRFQRKVLKLNPTGELEVLRFENGTLKSDH